MANQQAAVPHLPLSHHKISEKLVILNDRGSGLLIRLYNIRRVHKIIFVMIPDGIINLRYTC